MAEPRSALTVDGVPMAQRRQSYPQRRAPGDAVLRQRQQPVRHQGGGACRDAAEQHEHPILGLQAGEDIIAQAGLADGGGQGGGPDHPHRGGTDARHDHGRRQRQLHQPQRLGRRHAHAFGRHADGRIDPDQGGDSVAQHRQHRIERQRQQCGQKTQGAESDAEQMLAQQRKRQQQGIEQGQKRQRRNRLDQAGKGQNRAA